MIVSFGKHEGKSVELLVLKEPDYIKWVVGQEATGPLLAVQREANRLIRVFDSKPFVAKCLKCKRNDATRVSLYQGKSDPYWWCDKCNPLSRGADPSKIRIAIGYEGLLYHVECTCGGRKSDYRNVVRKVAELKGLPKRVGDAQSSAFFR